MLRTTLISAGSLTLLAGVGLSAYHAGANTATATLTTAQPEMDMEMDPMMQAMMEAGTPGEQHKVLASAAGEWKAHTKFMMQPGQFDEGEGVMSSKAFLGGRYTRATFKSDFMGMPFEGFALNGYDNIKKEYFSIWIDSMSTGVMHMTGQMKGDTLVFHGTTTMPEPMGEVEMKMEVTHPDNNTMHDTFYKKLEGQWVKDGEITYTRVSGGHDAHGHQHGNADHDG